MTAYPTADRSPHRPPEGRFATIRDRGECRAEEKPDAVVMECMAVQPQYQWISEQQMVQSHIGVITNARPDHLEEMGPTLDNVRLSLANTIPFNGKMIIGENDMVETIAPVANFRNTT